MRKIWIIAFCAFYLMCGLPPASGEDVKIDKALLEKILARQDMLEKKVEALQKKLGDNAAPAAPDSETSETLQYLEEDVEDINERLDVVERKSILDRVQISGDLQVRMEDFHYDDMVVNSLTGQKENRSSNAIGSTRAHLNLRSDITDNLIFHSRLTYYKLWGGTDFGSEPGDWSHPSFPDPDGDFHVERLYADYFWEGTPLSFTFGRLPSTEGPPSGFKNYKTRKSTWPKLMLDAESDGVIGNLVLDKWTGLSNNVFRVGYGKLRQNYLKFQGSEIEDTEALAIAVEAELPWFKDSFIWLGYINVQDVGVLDELPESAAPLTVMDYPANKSAGDIDVFNVHVQIPDIKKSGLSWFGSFSLMDIDPAKRGTVIGNIPVLTPQGVAFVENEVGMYGDSLHGNLGKSRSAHAFYTGVSYRIPWEAMKFPQIGFEYNYGSKYWTGSLNSGGGDILNKFDVNGSVYELYYIQPIIKKRMFCKFGAIYMDYDYYNPFSLYGVQSESDMAVRNFYVQADVRF